MKTKIIILVALLSYTLTLFSQAFEDSFMKSFSDDSYEADKLELYNRAMKAVLSSAKQLVATVPTQKGYYPPGDRKLLADVNSHFNTHSK